MGQDELRELLAPIAHIRMPLYDRRRYDDGLHRVVLTGSRQARSVAEVERDCKEQSKALSNVDQLHDHYFTVDTIRSLEPSDQDAIWDWLHVALWDPPPAGLRPREVLKNPAVAIYAEGWGREGDVGVVCEADGKDAGACWMRRIRGGVGLGYVDDDTPQLGIALMPGFRGRGFGRLLMVSALEAAGAAGYRQVSLTVHPQNPAVELYRSVGFEQKGLRNTYRLMVAPTAGTP